MIYIANDHAGFDYKKEILKDYNQMIDLGSDSNEAVDYPDYVKKLCEKMKPNDKGILICGSGQGMAMAANKFPHIRAALCFDIDITKTAREHNNANVLCLGARFINLDKTKKMIDIFLNTNFADEERHIRRVDKINKIV